MAGSWSTSPYHRDAFQSTSPGVFYSGNSPMTSPQEKSQNSPARWKQHFLARSQTYKYNFIDSHCHIDFLYSRISCPTMPFGDFINNHSDSFPANYDGCVSVFCNPKTFISYKAGGNDVINVVSRENNVWITAGCHPKNATEYTQQHADGLLRILKECPRIVALGEIGLDYSGMFHQYSEVQKNVFREQLQMAIQMDLPLVIHCREADDDCLEILKEIVPQEHKIHAHCFTRNFATAQRWLSLFPNLKLGLTPLITYKSALDAIESARNIPLDRLLLETDSPYFLPRGTYLCKNNEKYSHPGLALYTAEQVAWLRGIPVDDVLKACRENTWAVYGI